MKSILPPEQIQALIEHRNASKSPIGSISAVSTIHTSYGLAKKKMRIFGQYAVVYLLGGSGRYEDANGLDQSVTAGDMILVFPHLGHRYGPDGSNPWSEWYMVFNGPVFNLWESTGLLNSNQPIHHLEPIDYWLKRFQSILGSSQQTGVAPPLLEICRLQQVLGEALLGGPKGPHDHADAQWLSSACALLESDMNRPLNIKSIARQLHESTDSFRKRFAHLMGMPPGRWRHRRVIDQACQWMQQSDLSDKQIANRLEFCDPFHFSKRFKQIVGCSPRTFRQRLPKIHPQTGASAYNLFRRHLPSNVQIETAD